MILRTNNFEELCLKGTNSNSQDIKSGGKERISRKKALRINFIGKKDKEETPKIAIYQIDKGKIRKIDLIEGDEIDTSKLERLLEKKGNYGFGPDLPEDEITKNTLITFKTDKINEWNKIGILEISPKWKDWIFPLTCVHGNVKKCSSIILPLKIKPNVLPLEVKRSFEFSNISTSNTKIYPQNISDLSIHRPSICVPICNAVVEVYEKTCCCKIRLPEIDRWIERLKDWILKFPPPIPDPPLPEPIPIPLPEPIPGPDPVPFRQTLKIIKQGLADDAKASLGNLPERLVSDVETMYVLSPAERLNYFHTHRYLYPIFCSCSSRKVGETTVNESGEFSFCFPSKIQRFGCNVSYYYKVRQWQENQWVYIYDGSSVNDYFESNEEANLRTWKGLGCQPDGDITPGGNFVLLENVGVIPSWKLNSPLQVSESGVASANPDDGLVDHNYSGQPWGKTLSFRLKFSEGLQALGAKYYRISVVKANSSGSPKIGETPQIQTSPLAWRRWVNVGGQIKTEAISLGPNVVGGEGGLYLIPYDADAPLGWLWFQFHQTWNTTLHENGKHLVILEIFDAAGNRLKPAASPGGGNPTSFNYRRWTDEENTDVVNYANLTHMFHVDNISCYGDIYDLRKNGTPSTEECQFLTGCTSDNFSVGFYAFHKNNFMSSYHLWYHRGLNGPNITIENGSTNAPSGIPPVPSPLNSANAKGSNTKTFSEMLGPHPKCSFSIELRVYPKHTNGFGIIWQYRSSDNAAVALEKVNCLSAEVLTSEIPSVSEKI